MSLAPGSKARPWIVRIATVAAITFSLAMAVAGGVVFGHAVTTDEERPPEEVVGTTSLAPAANGAQPQDAKPGPKPWPDNGALAKAERIAESRAGVVAFAAIGPEGKEGGFEPMRRFYSASVSKAMLLVAELRRLDKEGTPLDDATRSTLARMITVSDNDAADAIYKRVGDEGLNEVARLGGMTGFEGDVGHWSNVKITAGDMARFMSQLDELLDLPHGERGSELLESVISSQAWGIPQAAPADARVRFKGGWRPTDTGHLVHQAALVELDGESYAIAVLTDGNPDQVDGEETIRLIAAALFG